MSSEIVVAIFPSRAVLTKALDHITNVRDVVVKRAAIVAKAASGEMIVLDDDIGGDEGGLAGGILGMTLTGLGLAQFGALALPGILPVLALAFGMTIGGLTGWTIGKVAADFLDFGFKNSRIDALATRLQAGRPALVLEIMNDKVMLSRLMQELNLFQAEFVQS